MPETAHFVLWTDLCGERLKKEVETCIMQKDTVFFAHWLVSGVCVCEGGGGYQGSPYKTELLTSVASAKFSYCVLLDQERKKREARREDYLKGIKTERENHPSGF